MNSWERQVRRAALAAVAAFALLLASTPAWANQDARTAGTLHVATDGDDDGTGSQTDPFRTVQHAVDAADAGTTVAVHAGTYQEKVVVSGTSGTADAPVTLTTAGDGDVVLTADLPAVSCDSSQPAGRRTLTFSGGVDHWTVRGLHIEGGVAVLGQGWHDAFGWLDERAESGDWKARRAVPAHGSKPAESKLDQVAGYLAELTGADFDPTSGIGIVGNEITGRGVWTSFAPRGELRDNTIEDIDCGTGPGAWINTYSDGRRVTANTVARVAESTHAHYMQEGIRLGGASSYTEVSGNTVSDLPGDGRAFTTDVDASFNTFSDNVARDVHIGFNEQMASWGNVWEKNEADGFRGYGFAVRLKDSRHAEPSYNSTSYRATFRCNRASGGTYALGMGTGVEDTFTDNAFDQVRLGKHLRSYWTEQGNRYDGSEQPPPAQPRSSMSDC